MLSLRRPVNIYEEHMVAKATRFVKVSAWVLLAVLGVALLASSALMWVVDTYYALPDGVISGELLEVLDTRIVLNAAQDTLEAWTLLLGQLGYPILLIVALVRRCTLTHKQKWLYVALVAGVFAAVSVPFAVMTPTFRFANHLFTPVYLSVVVLICVLVDSGMQWLRSRKKSKKK